MEIRENIPLKNYTTLGIGGPARYFSQISSKDELFEVIEFAKKINVLMFIIGGASNLVVSDEGFPGLIAKIEIKGIEKISEDGKVVLGVGAGEIWDDFVKFVVGNNLAGIECLSGIPGTVGATPIQNVGAYGQEISRVLNKVETYDRINNELVTLTNPECKFSYRGSIFNGEQKGRYIILKVFYELLVNGRPKIDYPDLKKYFYEKNIRPNLRDVRNAVIEIRQSKGMVIMPEDPDSCSVGSFFKNPLIDIKDFSMLQEIFRSQGLMSNIEEIPHYPGQNNTIKVPAAWIIEKAGFKKGYKRGNVGISSKHNLALINLGKGTAKEIVALMSEIQVAVREKFGVELKPEPEFVGF